MNLMHIYLVICGEPFVRHLFEYIDYTVPRGEVLS